MSTAARKQRQKVARDIEQMAGMAADLQGLAVRGFMLKGFQVAPVMIQSNIGPMQGVQVVFAMQDGKEIGPVVIDVVGVLNLVAAITGALTGGAVPAPHPQPPQGSQTPETTVATPGTEPAEAQPSQSGTTLPKITESGILLP